MLSADGPSGDEKTPSDATSKFSAPCVSRAMVAAKAFSVYIHERMKYTSVFVSAESKEASRSCRLLPGRSQDGPYFECAAKL